MLFRLDDFELDPEIGELYGAGHRVVLQRLPLDLLVYLVQNRDRIVPREELLSALWPGLHVSDSVLSTAVYSLRRALEDSSRDPGWIQTLRGRGFQFKGPCKTIERKSDTPAPIPLMARGGALAALASAADQARSGQGSIVIIPAKAGMGKTRLVREFLSRLSGFRVAESQADSEDASPTSHFWEQLLDQLGHRKPSGSDGQEPSCRLHERIQNALQPENGEAPLVVVLEDLHWAHSSVLGTVSSLLPRIGRWSTLIVATYRPDGEEPSASRLAQIALHPAALRLELSPLGVGDVYHVLGVVRGAPPGQKEVADILRRSEGVPLYVTQLAYEESGVGGVAESGILAEKLVRLSAPAQRGLGIGALIGSHFDLPIVEATATSDSLADRAWVTESIRAGILERDLSHPLRLRFAHALYREAASQLLDFEESIAAHSRMAEILEAVHRDPPLHVVRALARHCAAAVSEPGMLERAIHWDLAIARSAASRYAWADVLESTERLRDWLGRLPSDAKIRDAALEIELLHCAAIASVPNAMSRLRESVENADRLSAGAVIEDRVRIEGLRLLSSHFSGDYEASYRALTTIHSFESPTYSKLADCLSILPDVQAGQIKNAHASAVKLAGEIPLETRELFITYDAADVCLATGAVASWMLGDDHAASSHLQLAEARAMKRGDALTQATVLFTACIVHEMRSDWNTLAATAARLDPLCIEYDIHRFLGAGSTFEHWARDHLEKSLFPFTITAGIVRRRADPSEASSFRPYLMGFAARLYQRSGEYELATACFEEASAIIRAGELGFGAVVLRQYAEMLHELRRNEEAIHQAEEATFVARRIGASVSERLAAKTLEACRVPLQ